MEEKGTIAFGGSPDQKSLMHADQKGSLLFGPDRYFQAPLLTKYLVLTVEFGKPLLMWRAWGSNVVGPGESWS